ncbi:UDP-sugar pyrophospharylase [Gossypium arboreum]|uniref:UTP-monosaccharide-1-phosphate uridylyltransferase n=1 Tax=Gossypium arboreum TaxID=29729 RepID=A0A0B0N5H2_GOSAR|nr:UDP-sugar pyrophospharylase [Gossypium arboreum]
MFHLFIFEKSTIPARMVSATVDSEADILSNLNINAGDWPSNLVKNLCLLSPDQIELGKMLVEMGQSHLFQQWTDAGVEDDKKKAFFDQVAKLNTSYPGGLASYIKNARELLADSKVGKSPYDGFTPSVPTGEVLSFCDDNFIKYEEAGVKEAQNAAFVLVAGGLGERLGYNGIKVALLAEATTGTCFLQLYIEAILALQEGSCRLTQGTFQKDIPFVIMTSDDTHTRTLEVLESNSYFGMKPTQVKLLKQEKVACLDDNDARLALDPHNKYQIQTKPHGHGDVHSLLYSSGLLKVWLDAGLRWVLFFQDTNGLLFKAIPASLGVSATKQYQVNSLAVQRKAKEAMGGITRLTHSDGRSMVINVEYNQLDPLLRAAGHPDGDADCETGYSPFPGNINQLILELGPYIEELTKTGGAIKEFVMDKWLAYAPVKNNPEDASKVPKGNPYHSATSGEMAIYRANSLILVKAGVQVEGPVQQVFNGQEVEVWPRITWKPKWGLTFSEIKSKVRQSCSVSQRSTMVLKGRNIFLEDLSLDGALIINSIDGAEVKVEGSIQNKGWLLERIHYKDSSSPEELRIRGFKINRLEQLEQTYSETGKFILKPQC